MRAEPGHLELFLSLLGQRWKLRRQGFAATATDWLQQRDATPWPAAEVAFERLRRLSRWTRSRCLHRALALLQVAARRGHRGQLVLGARRQGEGIGAHAWVRFGAQSLGEDAPADGAFQPFPPPSAPR